MAHEIERKFLVSDLSVLQDLRYNEISQGYFHERDMKLYVRTANGSGFLVLQARPAIARGTAEKFEFPIPVEDAIALGANGVGLVESSTELSLNAEMEGGLTARIRLSGNAAYLTLKGKKIGITCDEYEYEIPSTTARLLYFGYANGGRLEKYRYLVPVAGEIFEVDVFGGDLVGLVVAELELPSEDHPVPQASWLGKEVTDDPRYRNSALALDQKVPK